MESVGVFKHESPYTIFLGFGDDPLEEKILLIKREGTVSCQQFYHVSPLSKFFLNELVKG